jgi:imidazole glycerol phosphate synthase subunit HisF
MNLTIKDLSASTELDRAAMTAVRGGNDGNSSVNTIGQVQNVHVPVIAGAGAGSAMNTDVHVDATQDASIYTHQNNGDRFRFWAGLPMIYAL